MVDHLHRNAAGCGLFKGAGGIAVEGLPGFPVDFRFEGGLECFIGVAGTQKIGMADKKALFVVSRYR